MLKIFGLKLYSKLNKEIRLEQEKYEKYVSKVSDKLKKLYGNDNGPYNINDISIILTIHNILIHNNCLIDSELNEDNYVYVSEGLDIKNPVERILHILNLNTDIYTIDEKDKIMMKFSILGVC